MKKKLSALILALVLCFSISAPAFAKEIAESSKWPAYGNGRDYEIWSSLYEDQGRYSAAAWIKSSDNRSIPVDQVQAQAFVKDGTGNVVKSSLATLSSPYYFLEVQTKYAYFTGTQISGWGILHVMQDNGEFTPFYTPTLTASNASRSLSPNSEGDTLPVTSHGETYGSLSTMSESEQHPDLVAAIGTEGQSGYVRYEDLVSADERAFDSSYGGKYIPLFNLAGDRIGNFFIEFTHPDIVGKDIETVNAELADSTAQNPDLWALADKILVDGKYPVNANGQTYAPEILREVVGYSPDLTPVINEDGLAGYVRCVKELPISAEEMAILNAATSEPLYDRDGNVIGTLGWYSEEPVQVIGKTITEVRSELASGQQRK